MAGLCANHQTHLQVQKPLIRNQEVPMYSCLTVDQTWSIPNHQTSQLPLPYKQRNNQSTNISVEPIKPIVMEQAQFRTPHLQQTQAHKIQEVDTDNQ